VLRATSVLCLLAGLGLASFAHAQESATASETALARQLFREGIDAARGGDFERARRAFARSYQLSRRPVTLLNLAGAQSQTGELVQAAESYRRYLRMTREDGDARRREAAEQALAALEPRIPHVVISVVGLHEDDRLELDGDELSPAALNQRFPVDPGEHRVVLERSGAEPVVEIFDIREGDDRQVSLTAPAQAPTPREVAQNGDRDSGDGESRSDGGFTGTSRGSDGEDTSGGSIFASPVFWIVTAVVVGGAAFAGWYFFLREDDPGNPPFRGNLGPGQLVLN
jgi:hypothetical protein